MASTTTAASEGEDDVSSSEEDNGDGDDSDTASAPSPTMLQIEEEEGQRRYLLISNDGAVTACYFVHELHVSSLTEHSRNSYHSRKRKEKIVS